MENKKLPNSYMPVSALSNLKWYKRYGLLTYINQSKFNEFTENPEEHFRTAKVINLEIMHKGCRGQLITDDLKKKQQKSNTIDCNEFVKYDNTSKYK